MGCEINRGNRLCNKCLRIAGFEELLLTIAPQAVPWTIRADGIIRLSISHMHCEGQTCAGRQQKPDIHTGPGSPEKALPMEETHHVFQWLAEATVEASSTDDQRVKA